MIKIPISPLEWLQFISKETSFAFSGRWTEQACLLEYSSFKVNGYFWIVLSFDKVNKALLKV